MPDKPPPQDNTGNTGLPQYREVRPGVRVATDVPLDILTVPSSISRTGRPIDLSIPKGTVVFTDTDVRRYQDVIGARGNLSSVADDLEKLDRWTGGSGRDFRDVIDALRPEIRNGARVPTKSFSMTTTQNGGRLIRVGADGGENLKGFANVRSMADLDVPQAYIDAISSAAADHELHHGRRLDAPDDEILRDEIRADFGSLREHFNKPFTDFMMDMRALSAINSSKDTDHHSVHIWSEEADTRLPTASEVYAIDRAPAEMERRAVKIMLAGGTWTEAQAIESIRTIPGRYGVYKALNERNAFDDIPYGREFADKFIAAGDRWYSQSVKAEAGKYKPDFDAVVDAGYANLGIPPTGFAPRTDLPPSTPGPVPVG